MKKVMLLLAFCLAFTSAHLQASVTLESFSFETTEQEQHFRELIEEIRCLVCQNQSLADSDAELAHDLRAEVYGMMQQGLSDDEIVDFLVARYGDFVLYNPPVKKSTWLIWFGPFVLLALALVMLWRSLRRQQHVPEQAISNEERQRLEQLLHDKDREDKS